MVVVAAGVVGGAFASADRQERSKAHGSASGISLGALQCHWIHASGELPASRRQRSMHPVMGEPSTGSAPRATLTDGSLSTVVRNLRELGDVVKARLKKGHPSPVVYVFDVFTTRAQGALLGSKDVVVNKGKEMLLVTTEDTVSGALGPVLGVRSGVKRLLQEDGAEMPAAKKRER
jgi:hypothetical protein